MNALEKKMLKSLVVKNKLVPLHQFSHIFGQMGVVVRLYPICFFCFVDSLKS